MKNSLAPAFSLFVHSFGVCLIILFAAFQSIAKNMEEIGVKKGGKLKGSINGGLEDLAGSTEITVLSFDDFIVKMDGKVIEGALALGKKGDRVVLGVIKNLDESIDLDKAALALKENALWKNINIKTLRDYLDNPNTNPSQAIRLLDDIAEGVKDFTDPQREALLKDLTAQGQLFETVFGKPRLVEAWRAVSKHADLRVNPKFLENISSYGNDLLKQLDEDLLNPKWADELKMLFKESPDDVTKVWKKLKEDPSEAWEISKAELAWEKWSQREFFKDATAKGKGFERDVCLSAFKNRSSAKYSELKNKVSADLGKNLDDYDMYSQVQLKYDGDSYFVADQLFVKYKTIGGQKVVDDVIVIENKLSSSTPLTTAQTNALQKTSFTVRSISTESEFVANTFLNQNTVLGFSDTKQWYKVHDGANGDVISGIQKMQ